MSELLVTIVDYAWGLPLVILLMGGGIYLAFVSQFKMLKGFVHAIRLTCGKFHHPGDEKDKGQVSHFRALTNALSATIGIGNIAGVAVAITQGGPGAIFWMWLSALIGMNTKFFECTLAMLYRGKDYRGEVQGGPMYVIQQALPRALYFLAPLFCLCGLIGTLALYNSNQLATYMNEHYSVSTYLTGGVIALGMMYILWGGVRRVGEVTSKIVPFMCVLYVLGCLGIIFTNVSMVPSIFARIFSEAFTGHAMGGGALGAGIMFVMQIGVKRAAFSNEAGIGTAPLAHGNAQTSEPVSEGLVAMLGPFLDTIIVCTMTALVILISVPDASQSDVSGVLLTQLAFEQTYSSLGTHILGLAIFLFSFSTILGTANYNQRCWDYLFKGRAIFGKTFFVVFYAATVFMGSISAPDDMINIMDIGFAFMAVPNMIATIILAPKVKTAMLEYFNKYKI